MPAEPPATTGDKAALLVAGGTLLDESITLRDSLQPGESNRADWSTSIGGVACNVFRAAATSINASLISALGDDDTGQTIRRCLEASHLAKHNNLTFKITSHLATGRYSAVLDQGRELIIGLANSSAVDALNAEEILQAMARQQNLQLLAIDTNLSVNCLRDLGNHFRLPPEPNQKAAKLAVIAVSPVKGMRVADLGDCVDYLFLNRQEAAMLTGMSGDSALARLSEALVAMHFNSHVLSDGAADALVYEKGERHSIPIKPQSPVSAARGTVNGAGDALAGATLAWVCQGRSLVDSVRGAGLAAAQTVLGGHSVLPWPSPGAPG